MAILVECPNCKVKFGVERDECSHCQTNLKNAKKKGNVRYWIHFRLDGKQKVELVTIKDEAGKKVSGSFNDAIYLHSQRTVQREDEPAAIEKKKEYTFQELTDDWFLKLKSVQSLAYFGTLSIKLNKFNSEFGTKHVNKIKPADLQDLQVKRKEEGLADSTIDQEIAAARTMINKAFDNDLIGDAPLRAFRKVKKLLKRNSNARDRILSQDEFAALLAAAPRHTKQILFTGFYTGMRQGEILSLTWDKVDLKKRVIQLEAGDTKDKEPRTVPVCDELYKILSAVPEPILNREKSLVFSYNGPRRKKQAQDPLADIRGGIKQACEKAGIEYGRFKKGGFVFHDLRHTFNTYMRKAGVAESVIMDITGHSTREMFDRYNTVDKEDRVKAVDQLESFLKANGKKDEANSR